MNSSTSFRRLPNHVLDLILIYVLADASGASLDGKRFSETTEDGNPAYLGIAPAELANCLQPSVMWDLFNFRLVNRRFNNIYKLRFEEKPFLFRIPEELKKVIIGHHFNMDTSGELISTNKKASLSVESFALHGPSHEDMVTAAKFRLVCGDFANRGLICQYKRVSIRFSNDFSEDGLEKLKRAFERRETAQTVLKLSYMVPRFYSHDTKRMMEILDLTQLASLNLQKQLRNSEKSIDDNPRPPVAQLRSRLAKSKANEEVITKVMIRAQQQRKVIEHKKDFEGLLFALETFTNLKQIRLMKLTDELDRAWVTFLDSHREFAIESGPFEWNMACEHSANVLAAALIQSKSRSFNRLSSRFIDPRTPFHITDKSVNAISNIARRLSSLELEFDNRLNLNEHVEELSDLLRRAFTEAVNLQSLHVGFRRLVSVPLGTVFHDIKFDRLGYLGLHQWELESSDLVQLLLRHCHIKSLRLRYIRLRRGSWATILKAIRLNLKLNWISLRGISYPGPELGGFNFPPAGPNPDDSDDDTEPDDYWAGSGADSDEIVEQTDQSQNGIGFVPLNSHESDTEDELSDSNDNDNDNDNGERSDSPVELIHTDEPHSKPFPSNAGPSHPGHCYCNSGYGWDSLNDTRTVVEERQWQRWQQWVLKPCQIHDSVMADAESESESESDGS